MSWAIGWDEKWKRDIGYGVPATCDRPDCGAAIDRGLDYRCAGCGLFFCGGDLLLGGARQQCARCAESLPPFEPTPDTAEWIEHKLTDGSWAAWRDENPELVAVLRHGIGRERDE